jgi:hypothetical protein
MTLRHVGHGQRMSWWPRALFAALLAVAGCSGESPKASQSATVGSARLALTSTSLFGAQYRLRMGEIAITGTETANVSTEDNLAAEEIVLELRAGGYLALLQEGWFLEKLVGMEWTTVRSQLTSVNPYPFTVANQATIDVRLTFKAGDDVIEMGHGRVKISIEVNESSPASACAQACMGVDLQCGQDELCEAICTDIGAVFQVFGECPLEALLFSSCAQREAAAGEFICRDAYPIPGACSDQYDAFIDCLCVDDDGDGACAITDCDDNDPEVGNPSDEICGDGLDQDCNGSADDGCAAGWTCRREFYDEENSDCDCGCGVVDPDCESAAIEVCDYCNAPGSCAGTEECPANINPQDNSQCLP